MRNREWMCRVSVALIVGLLALASPALVRAADPIKLNYSIFFPAPHKNTVLATEWAQEIEKRTNGAVKITIFPGGTLTPADKCYDGVVKGISDIGFSVLAYTRGRFPLTEVTDLPLGIKSGVAATKVINAYYQKFKPAEFDDVQVMYFHGHGPGILHTKKPVNTLDDLKGMKIRCTGMAAKIVTALGGVPVAMPMGETYDALSRGVVDGSMARSGIPAGLEMGRGGEVHHREFRLLLQHRVLCGHEQGQMEIPAPGCPENDRSGQCGVDRKNRQGLGCHRQRGPGFHPLPGQPNHRPAQGGRRKMGQTGPSHFG
jgi:hypothetical protein